MAKDTQLSINASVVAKMAELAAKEIDGVKSLAKKAMDLKGAVKNAHPFSGVKIESVNGALKITVYITVAEGAKAQEIAEKVQNNIKEKVQNMTGYAVTKIDVVVADIAFEKAEEIEAEEL